MVYPRHDTWLLLVYFPANSMVDVAIIVPSVRKILGDNCTQSDHRFTAPPNRNMCTGQDLMDVSHLIKSIAATELSLCELKRLMVRDL